MISINSSTIPVEGIGGIGMLALAAIMAAAFPIAMWLLAGGLLGGAAVATVRLVMHRTRHLGAPRTDLPIVLALLR